MTRQERMKALWQDPTFREKMRHRTNRRKYGELKAEREECMRRREAKKAEKEARKLERQRKREIDERIDNKLAAMKKDNYQAQGSVNIDPTLPKAWRCLACDMLNAPLDGLCFNCGEQGPRNNMEEETYHRLEKLNLANNKDQLTLFELF